MPIYSYQGSSIQIIDETKDYETPSPLPIYDDEGNRVGETPAIEMNGQRPSPKHIASETGVWILPDVEAEKPDQIEDLENSI